MCLRYPGGKTRAIKILEEYIPENITEVYSPFFGGGSFELYLCNNYQIPIFGNNKFEPLYNFWLETKKNNEQLVEHIKKLHPMNKQIFTECKSKLLNEEKSNVERAAAYFVVNRSSFSGSTISFSD
jgi:DNA adenine methylase